MNSKNYAIIYKKLITDEEYLNLSLKEIVLYSLMLDRSKLSHMNKAYFTDSKGVFIYYPLNKMTKHLRCHKNTAINAVNNLIKAGLIEKVAQANGLPNKYYVKPVFEENGNTTSNSYGAKKKNVDFGTLKIRTRRF